MVKNQVMVSTPLTYSSLATYASQEESDHAVNDVPARSGSSPCDFTINDQNIWV